MSLKLLLHMCCGPCSCYPVKKLRQDGIEPVGYFFNPNIHPYKEWDMRLKTAKEFAAKVKLEIRSDENYMLRDFLQRALLAERLPNGRCRRLHVAYFPAYHQRPRRRHHHRPQWLRCTCRLSG